MSGVCLAISREHFNRLGGFDESYLLDYSDVDICFKSSQAGLKVIYTPEACLYHMACVDKSLIVNLALISILRIRHDYCITGPSVSLREIHGSPLTFLEIQARSVI